MEKLLENPWLVEKIQDFSFLNCPECNFKTKEENSFQNHALKNHPLSSVFFVNDDKIDNGKKDQTEKTLEELMYPESDIEGKQKIDMFWARVLKLF